MGFLLISKYVDGHKNAKVIGTSTFKINILFLFPVPNIEVKGQPYALHLLLHGDQDGRCIARVMRAPHEMDASIHVQIASSQIVFDGKNHLPFPMQ